MINYFTKKSSTVILNGLYEPLESFLNQCQYKDLNLQFQTNNFSFSGGHDPPGEVTFRIMTMASRLSALFIVSAYTGAILSFILVPKFEYPFGNVKEFVEDGSYLLGYTIEASLIDTYSQVKKFTKKYENTFFAYEINFFFVNFR